MQLGAVCPTFRTLCAHPKVPFSTASAPANRLMGFVSDGTRYMRTVHHGASKFGFSNLLETAPSWGIVVSKHRQVYQSSGGFARIQERPTYYAAIGVSNRVTPLSPYKPGAAAHSKGGASSPHQFKILMHGVEVLL